MTRYTDFINYHLSLLMDDARTRSYRRAISEVVRKGDVVVDVGCGSGILTFLACRAGARHVYAIERDAVIEIAKLVAEKVGFRDRITFLHAGSMDVELPESADVVLTETMGTFGFEEGILGSITDARNRFCKKGGRLIPKGLDLFLVPVELPQFYKHVIDFWITGCQGFDFSPVRDLTVNNFHPLKLHAESFLCEANRVEHIEFMTTQRAEVDARVSFYSTRRGRLHGLAGWFNAELTSGLCISNGPNDPGAHWGLAFFPIDKPVIVNPGNRIEAEVSSTKNGEHWHWRVAVNDYRFDHSTLRGSPLSLV